MTLTPFSWLQEVKDLKNFLSALYLLKGWVAFNQNCIDISLGDAKELIKFAALTAFSRSQEVKECFLFFFSD